MTNEKFSFKFVTEDQVKEVIMNLDGSKATPIGGIFLDILKSTIDFYLPSIANSINLSIKKGCFSERHKLAELSPISKKKDDTCQRSERIMHHQINDYMKDKLLKQLKRIRKNHSTQHCLSSMLEIWKKVLDKGGFVFAIFIDLSKVFDTLNHNLLIVKLGAYGFETDALRYKKSCSTNKKQRERVNKTFSGWGRITTGVSHGSELRPLQFK